MSDTTGDSGLGPTVSAPPVRPTDRLTPLLFAAAIFTSASLVFVVQPMVTKLVLPMLGGSPAVWNTAMVFFQAALLGGYLYAHLLQRIASIKLQVAVHLALLLLAALFLPLQINGWLGDPDPAAPIGWLLATLTLSVGAPFAVLSATAPLLQAWFARVRAGYPDGKNPYVLYAASNLGSFLALLSYPFVIEPLTNLFGQRMGWTGGYWAFLLMIAALAYVVWRRRIDREAEPAQLAATPPMAWREKIILILLAAAPSSLMLGVTAHLSTDVASAPFLWVIPLALYLLTFVIAFQTRPWIPLPVTLVVQGALGAMVVLIVAFRTLDIRIAFVVHILAFFFAALMCHQMLASRRPPPDRLTEFYLLLSVGGVVGGAFTALLAPVIFNMVWEYPLVLVLVGLARPWDRRRLRGDEIGALAAVAVLSAAAAGLSWWMTSDPGAWAALWRLLPLFPLQTLCMLILGPAVVCAFLMRDRAQAFTAALLMIGLSAQFVARGYDASYSERSFFGVMRVAVQQDEQLGGDTHILTHGTTWHGAQARDPRYDCQPALYYHPLTPIGQSAEIVQARGPARIGVVGQGAGTMAAYKRAEDSLTFFEIDPMVDRMSRDPQWFTYISDCAVGEVGTVLGDARLTLEDQPAGSYDLLIVDAFSSDAVPTHLLTVEAIEGYLRLLKPEGVVLLHLSNRNLEIVLPTIAAAKALGRPALHGLYVEDNSLPVMAIASTEAVAISPTERGLADFRGKPNWREVPETDVRPWTDDYVNLFGALWRSFRPPPERP
ncbi:MAG: fused MFS/spermidine synthase [Brevundimonas sp.]|uniref:fused MFS/spermidine synthase n=1 Tax=Brevundimonas sp. TaxID=1871086 RepID=UPI00260C419D|nr:fused MFS/spermidine synthase [Brevundimonas sp.]MDI6624583.1 fused MFS/spermidine synthase [Brevundimonas sp.]MDQ7811328.1 fused MFS/spermidine synthase [Brevundimonas sp.]